MKELPIRSGLGHDLPEDEQQFLECVVALWHHVLDNWHQEAGKPFAIQHQLNDSLQSCRFVSDISLTCNRGGGESEDEASGENKSHRGEVISEETE